MKRECWTRSLGNCYGELTKEHIVSDNLLDDHVRVKGFPWCSDDFKSIGRDGLAMRILCDRHNKELRIVDTEIGRFFDAYLDWGKTFSEIRFFFCEDP